MRNPVEIAVEGDGDGDGDGDGYSDYDGHGDGDGDCDDDGDGHCLPFARALLEQLCIPCISRRLNRYNWRVRYPNMLYETYKYSLIYHLNDTLFICLFLYCFNY